MAGPDLMFRPMIYYAFISSVLMYIITKAMLVSIFKNGTVITNITAILLFVYLTLLFVFNNHSYVETRSVYLNVTTLLISIMVAPYILNKYGYKKIFYELYIMSSLILYTFITYILLLTMLGIYPNPMYNMSFISNGYLYASDIHVLPISMFIYGYYTIKNGHYNKNIIIKYTIIAVVFIIILLLLRRAAMFVTILAITSIISYYIINIKSKKNIQLIIVFMIINGGAIIISYSYIYEGIEHRITGLNRSGQLVSTDEGRFVDHLLVYDDMFKRNQYNKLIGYSFFNAPGNYGQGIYGDRNLHADLAVITHASGLVGLFLYLIMVFKLFKESYHNTNIIIWLFLFIAFFIFTLSGRITNPAYSISFFLLLIWTSLPQIDTKYELED